MFRNVKRFCAVPAASLLLSVLPGHWPQAARAAHAQTGRVIPEKRLGAATASYFPRAKHVTVQVTPLRVAGDQQNGVVLIPSFIVPGKKVVEPKLVNLQFIVDSPATARPPRLRVQVFSEGRELASGAAALVSTGKPAGGSVTRVMMYKLPYGKFVQFLKGRDVRIELGHVGFDITEEQLASMRDLQRMISAGVGFP